MTYAAFNELKRKGVVDQLWVIGPVTSFKPWEDEYETIFGKTSDISNKIFRYHGFPTVSKRISELSNATNWQHVDQGPSGRNFYLWLICGAEFFRTDQH